MPYLTVDEQNQAVSSVFALSRIIKWSDGGYRAEMQFSEGGKLRLRHYIEGEAFEAWKVASIDGEGQTVTIENAETGEKTVLKPGDGQQIPASP